MNDQLDRAAEDAPVENPFATRFTRPGALPFFFENGDSADSIVSKFVAAGRRGAIIGPHGSGKSTLLAMLLPTLNELGMTPILHTLHDGQRRLSRGFAEELFTANGSAGASPSRASPLLVVDGYEQLGWWGRREVRRAVERSGAGMLVTAHAPVAGLPTIFSTRPNCELAARIVRELTASTAQGGIAEDDVRRLYEQCGGNVRELCFKLYDLYESRRS